MSRIAGAALLVAFTLTIVGCGGGSGSISEQPPPAAKGQLSILPSSNTLGPAGRGQFLAVLTNINGSVNWTVDEGTAGGTIDSNGLYTAPSETGTFHLTVTSVVDTSVHGKATITVLRSGFTRAADMEVPRAGHTATLLRDGKVLLAGGDSTGTSAELFDPVSNSTTFTGSMEHSRSGHCAVLLDSGKVLVLGGEDSVNSVANAELYDPVTGMFSSVGNMTTSRWQPTATLLQNGKVLVVGGADDNNDVLQTAELFDPATNTFSATGSMNSPRVHFTTSLLNDGRALVTGGWDSFSPISSLSTAETYSPSTGNFTLTGEMTIIRAFQSATNLGDGTVLILGGSSQSGIHDSVSSVEVYDSNFGTFSAAGQLKDKRESHSATLLPNGLVLVAGGTLDFFDDDGLPNQLVLSTVELFDSSSGKSVSTGGLEIPRFLHTAARLNDGRVLVTGGLDNIGETSAAVELYK
jgi:hypothetical protein